METKLQHKRRAEKKLHKSQLFLIVDKMEIIRLKHNI